LQAFTSTAVEDGWLAGNPGDPRRVVASAMSNSGDLRVGDDAYNRQYRSILSFDSSAIPDNAVITGVTVSIKRSGATGKMSIAHGNFIADIKKGTFNLAALEANDLNAEAEPIHYAGIFNAGTDGWYTLTLNPLYFKYVNKAGMTQFRLRFEHPHDNDRLADYLMFFAGDSATDAPLLIVDYNAP
jgi:hypothetical protein